MRRMDESCEEEKGGLEEDKNGQVVQFIVPRAM
jgi:hypothetical protein